MFQRYLLIFLSISCAGCLHESQAPHAISKHDIVPKSIQEKLDLQEDAWNAGDIKGFMDGAYWQSDSLMFIGSNGLTKGFESTLSNYLKSYPNSKAMGTLMFELLEWKTLGARHGLLIGEWHLQRNGALEDLSGHFSLIWEKRDSRWMIIADHSS